ncbi:RING finger protein 151-like [Solea senegalensis]|uniref:RING finger protein 151-like n=1 Tax=Solea senegalensis TaxID=28829 RepID=A0AAV6PSU0_SOLSE|nr:E3 ubiquitin-protein ligase NRDP1 isoform X2 [Solea senegalensis]KAG7475333.1 RING finger protein 151-like [Solea senegalensis]KAG7475334.1 RING finger protein 151-like [Solea senegalensis]
MNQWTGNQHTKDLDEEKAHSSHRMGYDLERFVGYVNEGLLCCVCRDVLERPLQAPCEHAYCSACISNWLVHHHSCPEDRLPLDVCNLKPLYRYMRNDLNRLQIRCVNAARGCDVVCSLESLHTHEEECCPVQVERRGLEAHMSECNFRSRACPNGCGHTLLSADQSQHNCVAELRTEVEILRAEMLCKLEEVRREMESRLDSQRRHMVQKESQLKSEVEELKGQLSRVMCDMRALLGAERLRRQELAEAELEKRELLELLRDLQPHKSQHPVDQTARDKHQGASTSEREQHTKPTRPQQREASLHTLSLSLHSAQAINESGPPASPQLGEGGRKGGTRSLTLDCIKRKSREVTVI